MSEKMVKGGRKKKDVEVEDSGVKKRRGRKLAVDYYSTSACQKEMLKPSSTVSNTILQLNVEIKEEIYEMDEYNVEDNMMYKISEEFKKMQELKNESILEDYIKSGNEGSLEDVYKSQVKSRREQDSIFIKKLKDFSYVEVKSEVKEEEKSTLINELETELGMEKIKVLKELIGKEWPERTRIKCWWCCNNFDTVPIGVPIEYIKKINKYQVRGVYCSIACMYSGSENESTCKKKRALVREFYNKLTNASWSDTMNLAPPREVLKDFGGDMTIEKYREVSKNKNIYRMIKYPMILREDIVNISDVEKMKKTHKRLTASKMKMVDKPLQKTTISTLLDIEYEDE